MSIAVVLGVDRNDLFVREWHTIAREFSKYAHRHGPMRTPRDRSEFDSLWNSFENVLFRLVGTYYNLLDRVDRILKYKSPTKEIIETLPNLLALDVRYSYFMS